MLGPIFILLFFSTTDLLLFLEGLILATEDFFEVNLVPVLMSTVVTEALLADLPLDFLEGELSSRKDSEKPAPGASDMRT